MANPNPDKPFFGDQAIKNRGVLSLRRPINRGNIENWEDMEKMWQFSFYQILQQPPEERRIFMTETLLTPTKNREKMCEIMFEKFNVPYLFIGISTILAMYTSGRSNSFIMDSGYG